MSSKNKNNKQMKNNIKQYLLILFIAFMATACENKSEEGFKEVKAVIQTTLVETEGDAADDPAIWYNRSNPKESRIIGSDKKKGLGFYNLKGELLSFAAVGKINNIDVQYNFILGNDTIDVVGGSNRSNNAISLFKYNPLNSSIDSQELIHISSHSEEIYGFCFYKNIKTNELFSLSIGKDGLLEQYKIYSSNGHLYADSIQSYRFDTQCEGLVADHENGVLFVAEENRGVWKLDLTKENPEKECVISIASNPNLKEDIEGLSLYYSAYGYGYLIISSQGNNSYAILDRKAPHNYIGSFVIVDGKNIDGTSETDGIDVINIDIGDPFINGFFIAQDGENTTNGELGSQNFKLVPWNKIAVSFEPPLIIDNKYISFD